MNPAKRKSPEDVAANDKALLSFSQNSYLTHRALAGVLSHCRTHGIPEHFSTATQHRARKRAMIEGDGRIVEEITLQTPQSKVRPVAAIQDPSLVLQRCVGSSAFLSALFKQKLAVHPCTVDTPWSLIIYTSAYAHWLTHPLRTHAAAFAIGVARVRAHVLMHCSRIYTYAEFVASARWCTLHTRMSSEA